MGRIMVVEEIRNALRGLRWAELPALNARVWAAYAAGELTDDQAAELDVATRKPQNRAVPSRGLGGPVAVEAAPAPISPAPKARQLALGLPRPPMQRRAPDTRRRWAASGWIPPNLAVHFTQAEQAVLGVIAWRVSEQGLCDWPHEKIASLAGVSKTTARNAVRLARKLGLVSVEARPVNPFHHEANVVRIIAKDWGAWVRFRTRKGVNRFSPLNTLKEELGFSRGRVASSGAPELDSRGPPDPGKCASRSPTRKTRSA